MLRDWKTCAQELGRALSRYDGHSTYARLEYILSIPTSTLFDDNPSCFAAELISEVEARGVTRRAAYDHLRHGISLGFLERVISGGGIFKPDSGRIKKIDETARIALSSLGRVLRVADRNQLNEFRDFLVTTAILDYDFDMYALLLISAESNKDSTLTLTDFSHHLRILLQQRKEWLEMNLPTPALKAFISSYALWINRQIKPSSIKHHFNLRRQWARHLLHIDKLDKMTDFLTDAGKQLAGQISAMMSKNTMFWLAPDSECMVKLGILSKLSENVFSASDLFRPDCPEVKPGPKMIQQVASFMEEAFEIIRLHTFPQAPISAIVPYIHFQELYRNERVNLRTTLDTVIREHRDKFYCMLTTNLDECYYQLRHPPA